MKSIDKENFEKLIKTEKYLVVDFFATWCPPCQMYGPIFEKVASLSDDKIKMIKVDVDQLSDIASSAGVTSLPTTIVFKNGKVQSTTLGIIQENELLFLVRNLK